MVSATAFPAVKTWLTVCLFLALLTSPQLDAIVISEINYNPPLGAEDLEFVEVTNDNASPEDISGWAFVEGIDFEFPQGTILHGGEILVVCANEAAMQDFYDIRNTIGNYQGRLDAGGERLTLVNHAGIVMQDLRYNDAGKWPIAADGTGHTMIVKSVHIDTSEPESWCSSRELGGSPGFVNDPERRDPFDETPLIEEGDLWRFKKGTGPFSDPPEAWRESTFDDGSWDLGPSGFGHGDGDDNTVFDDMRNGYTSVAIRTSIDLTAIVQQANSRLFLGVIFDDGFCAYVNGVEFARKNCPEVATWDATAAGSAEALPEREEVVEIPNGLLNPGDNVIALVGYNSRITDRDFSLIPRLLHRDFTARQLAEDVGVVFNELYRGSPSTDAWVELFNHEPGARDLSGWTITNDPDRENPYVLPEGTIVGSGDYLVVDEASSALALSEPEVKLFLIDPRGLVGSVAAFDESPTAPFLNNAANGDATGAYAEARFPDGGRPGWVTPIPTLGAANEVPRVTELVINEIFYHPPDDRDGEFLELHNHGSEPLDLSGFRFTRGIDYIFPAATTIAAGGYLVVAEEPAVIRERYGLRQVLGPWDGTLANRGENVRLVDAFGNLVDEVRYFDGDRWSIWADGRGSSLELVDPRHDNELSSSWEASDESEKSSWEEHTFTVNRYVETLASKVHLVLVERGICRVDDLSVITDKFDETEIVPVGDEWRFSKGIAPFSTPENAWRDLDFDDSAWLTGVAGFGYGDHDDATVLDDMRENYSSIVLRKRFHVDSELLAGAGGFALWINYDDGFCAYLNGVEIARANCPEVASHAASATRSHEALKEELFEVPTGIAHAGENILAIVGFNRRGRVDAGDDDFSLTPRFVHRRVVGLTDSYVPNSGFEEETMPWVMTGTHAGTRRITHDARAGKACMEVVATGRGDTQANQVEVDTDPVFANDIRYDVSLWTRWIRGSSFLILRGEFSAGPWPGERGGNSSGNPLSRGIRMSVPWDLGTPGAENSQRVILSAETGSDNLGPGISDVVHSPLSPPPGTPVQVRACVADPDGVTTVRVFYRNDDAEESTFESVELLSAATFRSPDAFAGEIPPVDGAAQVLFYVEAVDGLGAVSRFPAAGPEDAPEKTLIYRTDGPVNQKIQLLFSKNSWSELQTRPLYSNALLDGKFILDNEVVHSGVGMRYRGGGGRALRNNFRVRFGNDQLYKGKFREINVSSRDTTDGAAYPLIGRNGTPEVPAPVAEYHFASARVNGMPLGTPGVFEPIGKQFIEKWYGEDAARRGILLKVVGRPGDGLLLQHRQEDAENYRFYFRHSMHQSRDEWRPLMDLTRVIDDRVTPDAEFDQQLDSVVAVEAFLRTLAPRILMHDTDGLFVSRGHNGYLFWEPTNGADELEGLWHYIPFDMGQSWNQPQTNLLDISDPYVLRLVSHPRTLRSHYRLLHEYLQGYWSNEIAGPFLDALSKEAQVGQGVKAHIRATDLLLTGSLDPFINAEFRILTGGGLDFETGAPFITLNGEASVLAVTLVARINDGEAQPFAPTWTSASEWSFSLPITSEVTRFELHGFDKDDQPMGTAAIAITRTSAPDFSRGDVDGKGSVNVGDAITTLLYLFSGRPLACADAADFDDSGEIDLRDAVATLEYLFQHGAPPAAPFPERGVDPTADALGECRQ